MEHDVPWRQLAPLIKSRLVHWLRTVGSKASVAQAEIALGGQPMYLHLAERWDRMSSKEREVGWTQLEVMLRVAAYGTRPFCIQCGACCTNAGPTLHKGDETLVTEGQIGPSLLRTLRAGEEVFSHQRNDVVPLRFECVMVVPGDEGGCYFHNPANKGCDIYDKRPLQCRAQKCWDIAEAEALVKQPGLTRLDLLPADDSFVPVIQDHEERCSAGRFLQQLDELAGGSQEAGVVVVEMIEADRQVRLELIDGEKTHEEVLPFLLGRPLESMVRARGYVLSSGWSGQLTLRKVPSV